MKNLKILYLAPIFFIMSCGSIKVTNQKLADGNENISKAYVYVQSRTEKAGNGIVNKIKEKLSLNNIEHYCYLKKDLDLKTQDEIIEDAQKMGASHMIYIELFKHTRTSYGQGGQKDDLAYSVNIINLNSSKNIWHGEMVLTVRNPFLNPTENYVNKAIDEIFVRMKNDGILK